MIDMLRVILGQNADGLHQVKAGFGGVVDVSAYPPALAPMNADMHLGRVAAVRFGLADGQSVFGNPIGVGLGLKGMPAPAAVEVVGRGRDGQGVGVGHEVGSMPVKLFDFLANFIWPLHSGSNNQM